MFDYTSDVKYCKLINKINISLNLETKLWIFFRYIFWTETGNKAKIGKAIMDGTFPRYIVTTRIEMPNGLTADCEGKVCTPSANTFFKFKK